MTRGLILAAPGYAESHLEYAYHRLREDAVLVDVASPDGGTIRGDRGGEWAAVGVEELLAGRRYDLVVVPGGGAPAALIADDATRDWLAAYLRSEGIVCAVAEGLRLLVELEAIEGRLVTGPDGLRAAAEAAGATFTEESVTVDGPFVTVRDTAALPFGVAAALASVAIPQGRASEAAERPAWLDESGRSAD